MIALLGLIVRGMGFAALLLLLITILTFIGK